MKAKPTLEHALYVEGLPEGFVQHTPADFWTREAFALFQAAARAGIIAFDDLAASWTAGPNYTKAALAYFCKRASKRLHLNNGAQTNWAPFESMFHFKPKTLRRYLHNVQERNPEGRQADTLIDTFFEQYGQQ